MKKNFSFLILLIIGCSQGAKTGVSEIVVGLEGSPSVLNPVKAGDAYSVRILPLIFNGVLKMNPDLTLSPDLAKSVEFEREELVYRIELRRGVLFHDGKELTAEDVAFTYEWIMNPDNASPYYSSFREVKKVKIRSRYSLDVYLKKPFSPFKIALTIGILNSEVASKDMETYYHKPVGTGPYMVKEFIPFEKIVLERFDKYFRGINKVRRIIFRMIPDDNTRVMELIKGRVDLLQNSIPPDYLSYIVKNKNLSVRKKSGVNCTYLAFNLRVSPFSDPLVRKAFAYAIDRASIVKYILRDTAKVTESLLSQEHWTYNPFLKPYPYNPERAESILDSAGYKKNKEGWRFEVKYITSTNPLRRRIAEVIKHYLERIGIKIKVVPMEWGTLYTRVNKGNFEIYTMTWVGITDPDIFFYIFHSSSIPPLGANRGGYINPEVDVLVERGRKAYSIEKRKAIYRRVQEIIHNTLPYVHLWISENVIAYKKGKGLDRFVIYPGGEYTSLGEVR